MRCWRPPDPREPSGREVDKEYAVAEIFLDLSGSLQRQAGFAHVLNVKLSPNTPKAATEGQVGS